MKVGVLTNYVPFLRGGAELLAEKLVEKLVDAGHQAELYSLPFAWNPCERVLESLWAARALDLRDVDHVIALKFPAYCVRHPRKSVWLLHQFRQAYDLWNTPLQDLPSDETGRRVRDLVRQADNRFLPEARNLFVNSEVTAGRLMEFNGIESKVLFPPPLEQNLFRSGPYGDVIFCPSRITNAKRQYLLIEAMRYVSSGARLLIAGSPENRSDLERLEQAVRDNGVASKVQIRPVFISDQEKADSMAEALACAYIPYNEDSYGYVTLEAFSASRPVITCDDAGGLLTIVEQGDTGLVAKPDARSLAHCIDLLYRDRTLARRMGENGRQRLQAMGLSWESVIAELLA